NRAMCFNWRQIDLNCSNRPVRTRMPGGVAGVGQNIWSPLCRFLNCSVFGSIPHELEGVEALSSYAEQFRQSLFL
ncbi:hypothetical protein CSQ89_21685, partial [Chitinimonas sp. BJB300]